jgi:hypothetical protein
VLQSQSPASTPPPPLAISLSTCLRLPAPLLSRTSVAPPSTHSIARHLPLLLHSANVTSLLPIVTHLPPAPPPTRPPAPPDPCSAAPTSSRNRTRAESSSDPSHTKLCRARAPSSLCQCLAAHAPPSPPPWWRPSCTHVVAHGRLLLHCATIVGLSPIDTLRATYAALTQPLALPAPIPPPPDSSRNGTRAGSRPALGPGAPQSSHWIREQDSMVDG